MPATSAPLTVRLLHTGCPHVDATAIRLRVALDATGHQDTPIDAVLVRDDEQARSLRFHGSPTVLLNGRDPFTPPDSRRALTCRSFTTDTGAEPAPSIAQLVDAILAVTTA